MREKYFKDLDGVSKLARWLEINNSKLQRAENMLRHSNFPWDFLKFTFNMLSVILHSN